MSSSKKRLTRNNKIRGMLKFFRFCCLSLMALALSPAFAEAETLPQVNFLESEKTLGTAWLKQYRSAAPILYDPLLNEYNAQLVNKLSTTLGLTEDDLQLVIAKNHQLNAFAVPGGVIGIHSGLFRHANTEAQYASVIAHELAHLSQRHYARSLSQQKTRDLATMSALLGALVIAANGQETAGQAAFMGAQAANINNALAFSRDFENEADSIGMHILKTAGFPPSAMAEMFEQMQIANRFNTTPPEFFLTHPITNARIANAKNRILLENKQMHTSNITYQLMRSRVLLVQSKSPQQAVRYFKDEINGFPASLTASQYGLAIALLENKDFSEAEQVLKKISKELAHHPAFIIAQSDVLAGFNKSEQALALIDNALTEKTNFRFSLTMQKVKLLNQLALFENANRVFKDFINDYKNEVLFWYESAETAGLAGDIYQLHKARTEYFILHGQYKSATNQLKNIEKKFAEDTVALEYARDRSKDIEIMIKEEKI